MKLQKFFLKLQKFFLKKVIEIFSYMCYTELIKLKS